MEFKFNIAYRTQFGERVVLYLTKSKTIKPLRYEMHTSDGKEWKCRVSMGKTPRVLRYFYQVEKEQTVLRCEWTLIRHLLEITAEKADSYILYDKWEDMPEDSYLYSSAFTDCVNNRRVGRIVPSLFLQTVRLKVRAPQLVEGERLAVVGQGKALKDWNVTQAIAMVEQDYNEWIVDLDASDFPNHRAEFKFVVLNKDKTLRPLWETGYNRILQFPQMEDGTTIVYELGQSFLERCNRRLAGTLVPVFSLRSKKSFGVGDFGDLKRMIDWISMVGQRVLQILPVNDTTTTHTWTDSYPYSCISIFALHPQYADFNALPILKDTDRMDYYRHLQVELNSLPQIDYERVNAAKCGYLHELYGQEGRQILKSADFKKFFKETERWLVPYAHYCVLRDEYHTADFSKWHGHTTWNEKEWERVSDCGSECRDQLSFWFFVQYILDSQMKDVHRYARSKGVILKGDIPIGVNRQGCDVWMEPEYFNLNGQAGAPPDAFSVNGQNWGFPTYNWGVMLKDHCRWWVHRFQNMAKYFDAYRIDHILGFFRIWEIPINAVQGILGQFSPALGLSIDEIRGYGLNFQERRFTEPFITDWVLDRVFHDRIGEVREKYLEKIDAECYCMRPEYDTQRKIKETFGASVSESDKQVRDGLYTLISDVLFVRDYKDCHKFHPRISAQFNFIYESLSDCDKAAFNRLYDDYFYRRNNTFWQEQAMKKLPRLIQSTRMLVCAEDLGMVPACVPEVINRLKILSLEIQSMPKESNMRFSHLERNPYRSVSTISSHDMPTLRQWWDEDLSRTQDYYHSVLGHQGAAPHPLPGWLAKEIISCHLYSPSMLCVLSIQDWLSLDESLRLSDENGERINIPSDPHHYWRYRMHLNIEDLISNQKFSTMVSELIRQSGRG
ncbi:4-alpha-glucanotransferase [Prevotella cerevisiae]|jgi:4-alpha-glucanotransferase|uniref:4-alpha-glucanotransferase n=1 Tax=Segatella cerevisiae TaxID=2053716 RepID=A0ABT1BXD5_9BACT|nr:4-alpha-glucanotransferase [Segatella cerevisiae]MCH3995243.1 4-alpha-glucanotransferase [Prevotella sp.]MCO6025711.1 4-alpha-glucanotransferase [Segatella cerevisiae]